MSKEEEYKQFIAENLETTLRSGYIPEFEHKEGKVRDVHFSGDKIIAVASDRVSAFDEVLTRQIPFKGIILNLLNLWAMGNSTEIIPNATLNSPDPNVIVQTKLKNTGFECIVRGYVWGSLAGDYEKGNRVKSGIQLPDNLIRYQKLEQPIFTPTTKAEVGHDEDITLEHIAQTHGMEKAKEMEAKSLALYQKGSELAAKAGLILLDTKFEFGFDADGNLILIDECITPDSSRYCTVEEYEIAMTHIKIHIDTGKYQNVSQLLEAKPELKIKEASKQYVRDVLIEGGFQKGNKIVLTDEQVIETSWRYINLYEKLTGSEFDFAESDFRTVEKRIMSNLVRADMAYGGCVVPMLASQKADMPHWEKIKAALDNNGIPHTEPFFGSAHKETQRVLDYVGRMTANTIEPIVFITSAGRSNGLGPVVAGNTKFPVIACNPYKDIATYMVDIHSSLRMPSKLPMATITDPGNAVAFAKRMIDMIK